MANRCCGNCKWWETEDQDEGEGECKKFSGEYGKKLDDNNNLIEVDNDIYPEFEETGIESTPYCAHDGCGFKYLTKDWFCCIHYKIINKG